MKYEYKNEYDEITTLEQLKKRVIVNALCFTNSIKNATTEVGISERTMHLYIKDVLKLEKSDLRKMRKVFKESNKKVKKRFKYDS